METLTFKQEELKDLLKLNNNNRLENQITITFKNNNVVFNSRFEKAQAKRKCQSDKTIVVFAKRFLEFVKNNKVINLKLENNNRLLLTSIHNSTVIPCILEWERSKGDLI